MEFIKTHFLPGIKKGGRHQDERSAYRYSMLFPMEIFQSNVHKKERWCRPCRCYYTLAASDEKGNERPAKTTKADKSREMDEIKLDLFEEAVKPASQESNNSISLFVKSLQSQLQRFSGRQLAIAKKRINDVIFDLDMECYAPQGPFAPTSSCRLQGSMLSTHKLQQLWLL